MKETSKQTLGEEIANAISHGIMAIFGIVAMILLIVKGAGSSWVHVVSAVIFGLGIILLYTMSTLYHALAPGKAKNIFRRFDHLSIYILIGGTFASPLLLLPGLREPLFKGFISKGLTLFIGQWILITIGVVFKSIWVKKYMKLHVFLFLLMGWSSLTFAGVLIESNKEAFIFILLGGIAYSIGVIFFALGKIKYFHFIWHIFTALGTILQFIAIYGYLY